MNRRTAGIVGFIGAIVLLVGDMLLYGHWGSAADFWVDAHRVAEKASLARIYVGGLLGPVGAMLYLAGFWHIYLNTRQAGRFAARMILVGLTAMIVTGSAYHVLWGVRMLSFKYGLANVAGFNPFTDALGSYLETVFKASAAPGYLVSAILAVLVLMGRSRYPRWTVLANPGLLMLFGLLLGTSFFPAPVGAVIMGGYINLTFCVFFAVSIITTWKKESDT
ncbi:MAG: hypothetical protein KJ970_00395 [Candidatus Eisenbacteria bacterium]|uniref:DUF4386 family protein n=1 Tax=Eiseniibacteriota bacterium TaxID=2212470 RepID=A0A948RQW0_UNCEI|nr:hypothetical protein [Candidatus Eisenbacteria bacterium]MBU1949161.1 hypothetical protein [Candidatus Eisenbacteria bacterium]MBU2689358.1 hypothetical protein [Candidatus Eisenbacteria bacterium]